jgi:SAM-dependent methyltransferase
LHAPPPSTLPADLDRTRIARIVADLGLPADGLAELASSETAANRPGLLAALEGPDPAADGSLAALAARGDEVLAPDGLLLLFLPGRPTDPQLARVRDGLWPRFHVVAVYTLAPGRALRRTLQGERSLEQAGADAPTGVLLAAHRREHVQSPAFTVEKFDQAAAGWNGTPGSPGYPHFRWMRRLVGRFGRAPAGARILDFGCGAGWVGIEAAQKHSASELRFFDPSGEMVAIAAANAEASGIADARGATGFGERPPFPTGGEAPFDLVLSSGVISFAPDPTPWLDGVAATVAPGGVLVIGDLHRDSRGFRRRRARRPLLPVRELNALTREEVCTALAQRGFSHEASAAYQLTRPFPEALHVNEERLGGLLTWPLLWANRLATAVDRGLGSPAQDQFDSWVMRLRRTD